jgi:hypothetical protein
MTDDGQLQQAMSVRFTEQELNWIRAYAVVEGTSPNAVIRRACEDFLRREVGSERYEKALAAYRERCDVQVAALEELRLPGRKHE